MNSKKLERNQKGSMSSTTTGRSSTVIDDADAHESNTKKFSSCCLVGNWTSDKLQQNVSWDRAEMVKKIIQFLNRIRLRLNLTFMLVLAAVCRRDTPEMS